MSGVLDGKVVSVTEAAGGIGEGYARAISEAGAQVVAADVDEGGAKRVAEAIQGAGGDATAVRVDIASSESCTAMAEATVAAYGGIDGLVNNAALFGGIRHESLLHGDFDYYLKVFGINGLTRNLAMQLGDMNIRINAVAPGPTDTEALRARVSAEIIDGIGSQMALKRRGQPEDVAGTCVFLLSEASAWMSGQIPTVDGGHTFRV